MAPRKNESHPVKRETIEKRPTGTYTSIAAAVIAVAAALGVPISTELGAALVGLVGAVSSWRNPR